MKVYIIGRRLKVGDGEVVIPLRVESRKEDALSFGVAVNQKLSALLDCHLVKPKGGDEGEDTGVTLAQFLGDLGILGFKSEVEEVEVNGASILVTGQMPSGAAVKWQSSS